MFYLMHVCGISLRFEVVFMIGRDYDKPLSGKLNDSVEFPLEGSWTFAHLDVLAVFRDWRIDLRLGPGLGLLQAQKFGGG